MRVRALGILLCALLLQPSLFLEASGLSDPIAKIIRAEDIMGKIEIGAPIDYNNVIIEGDLNLSHLQLSSKHKKRSEFEQEIRYLSSDVKLIESPIRINGSEIRGAIYSDNMIFNRTITFSECTFDQDVHFRGTQFGNDVSFQDSSFARNAYFEWAEFYGKANFQDSIFYDSSHLLEAVFSDDAIFKNAKFGNFVDMRGAKFGGLTKFDLSIFAGDAHFEEILFSKDVDFKNSQFYGAATFWAANFEGESDFRGTKFYRDAIFSNSQFRGIASFGDTRFDSNAGFRKSIFLNDLLFENSLFKGNAEFRDANFEKNVGFENVIMASQADFSRSQFSNNRNSITKFLNTSFEGDANFAYSSFSPVAQMRNSRFNRSLNMTQAIFDRMEIRWDDIKNCLIGDDSIYISFINNFRNLGQFGDYDNCIYQYGRYRLAHEDSIWSYLTDMMSWITCGFGVRPHFAIAWALSVITVFGYIYHVLGALQRDIRFQSVFQSKKYGKKMKASTFREALYFSAMVFLVSLPPQGLRSADKWRYAVMFEDVLGWILMTLFVVTLGHVMIR
jgi:hypothetical protein